MRSVAENLFGASDSLTSIATDKEVDPPEPLEAPYLSVEVAARQSVAVLFLELIELLHSTSSAPAQTLANCSRTSLI